MHEVILTRGIQGSGKSTWAKNWVLENPTSRVRINMDDIRSMLGKYWVPSRENLVKEIYGSSVKAAIKIGYDIVIDNMNLSKSSSDYIKSILPDSYTLEYKDFLDTPLSECIRRDKARENPVGEEVIRSTFMKYKDQYPLNGN